jgi:antitoxin (DNA-binding transcriptional repressor) of toxin-antitoxin stability system
MEDHKIGKLSRYGPLTRNFLHYLRKVKAGERIIILERNIPIADMIPHNENIAQPGWKRVIKKIKLKGKSLSQTVIQNRREEKY